MKYLQSLAPALLLTLTTLSLQAQKLPNMQEASLYAPAIVKVDARLADWGNLQAFNKTVGLNYTVANDAKNLYLVIKADDPMIANKIIAGGIDLIINTQGKKNDKDAFVISFSLVQPTNLRDQMAKMRSQGGPNGQQMDSAAIARMRKQAVTAFKEIKLVGFKDIADSVVSIYNEYGIKAAADYDNKGALICELAMPLKYMGLTGSTAEFAYSLRLNGLNVQAMLASMGINMQAIERAAGGGPGGPGVGGGPVVVTGGGGFAGGGGGFPGGGGNIRMRGGGMNDMQGMTAPTDFWSKYTLAKK